MTVEKPNQSNYSEQSEQERTAQWTTEIFVIISWSCVFLPPEKCVPNLHDNSKFNMAALLNKVYGRRLSLFHLGAVATFCRNLPWLVFIHEFLITYRERASLRASERYGIKNSWIKAISGSWHVIICLLHITCFKKSSHQVEVQESVVKTAKQFFPPNLAPGVSLNLTYNVQPDWSNQIITIYLIGQFKPVKWYDIISLSEMISYHFTGINHFYSRLYHTDIHT